MIPPSYTESIKTHAGALYAAQEDLPRNLSCVGDTTVLMTSPLQPHETKDRAIRHTGIPWYVARRHLVRSRLSLDNAQLAPGTATTRQDFGLRLRGLLRTPPIGVYMRRFLTLEH